MPPAALNPDMEDKKSSQQALHIAWAQYANYRLSAILAWQRLTTTRRWLLIFTCFFAALALIDKLFFPLAQIFPSIPWSLVIFLLLASFSLLMVLFCLPAIYRKWARLEYCAGIVSRCIYHYRSHTHIFSDEKSLLEELRHLRLFRILGRIEISLYTAGLKVKPYQGALPPSGSTAGGDDGFSSLDAAGYLQFRLLFWLEHYRLQIRKTIYEMRRLFISIMLCGMLLIVFFIASYPLSPALIILSLLAIAAYLRYSFDSLYLKDCNQAYIKLDNIHNAWQLLPPEKQREFEVFEKLSSDTEDVLFAEHTSWLHQTAAAKDFPLKWDDLASPPASTDSIPPDITPEMLAAAFEIALEDHPMIEKPGNILNDPRIEFHPEIHQAFATPQEFYAQSELPDASDLVGQEKQPADGEKDDHDYP